MSRAIQNALAAGHDAVAASRGCSDFERSMRSFGPLFFHGNATLREISITCAVLEYRIIRSGR